MVKKNNNPNQVGLFGNELYCQNVDNLPLITNPMGEYEVLAPGSVYQPILLSHHSAEIKVGPGKLNTEEEKLIRDLVNYLYPDGKAPKSEKTPLRWGEKEVWIKRNLEKNEGSFRLRVDDSDWFYPDFIFWIIDHENKEQVIGFVDPKGLALGAKEGWADPKIVATMYAPHVIQQAINGEFVSYLDEGWTVKIRGALVATKTGFNDLSQHKKFNIRNVDGENTPPSEAEFQASRIIFQKNDLNYIEQLLILLTQDSRLDLLLQELVVLQETPLVHSYINDLSYDLSIRIEQTVNSDCELVGNILEDYLFKSDSNFGMGVKDKRRKQLLSHSKDGHLGGIFGAEKVYQIRDISNPCEELWRRKFLNGNTVNNQHLESHGSDGDLR
ncbi:hypothetical protein [Vibrio crassostreae]|uniref:hypothetical protein n=1 Tax=Vibrio crassostreae TaxID=246167 RepID=UPI00037EC93C|nr:hypothetical protein [Vibrio crassostreae]OEE87826.1 hypothetical protein A140_07365 [Vibrio crassostreae 9ZC88]